MIRKKVMQRFKKIKRFMTKVKNVVFNNVLFFQKKKNYRSKIKSSITFFFFLSNTEKFKNDWLTTVARNIFLMK